MRFPGGSVGLIPGSEGSVAGDNGNPLQYYCRENLWTKEPGRLQSLGLQRVGQDWVTKHAYTHACNIIEHPTIWGHRLWIAVFKCICLIWNTSEILAYILRSTVSGIRNHKHQCKVRLTENCASAHPPTGNILSVSMRKLSKVHGSIYVKWESHHGSICFVM